VEARPTGPQPVAAATVQSTIQPAGAALDPGAADSMIAGSGNAGLEDPRKAEVVDQEKLADDIEKVMREVYVADLEYEIAVQKSHSAEAKAEGLLEEALAAFQAAGEASGHYTKKEAPAQVSAAQLKIDELAFRLEMSKLELAQMEREYGKFQADSHAGETGKIVIWRETQAVDHAARGLTQEEEKRKTLLEYSIPRKQRELALAVSKTKRGVERAKENSARIAVESKLGLRKAKDKQGLLKYKIKQLRAKREGL
jgi:hypothetical protein